MSTNINFDKKLGVTGGTGISLPSSTPAFSNTKSIALSIDDYVDMSNPSNLNFDADNPFTFSVWFKRSSDTNAVALFDKSLGSPNNNGYICFIYNNQVYFRIRQSASLQHQINNNNTHPFNTWVHYVITYDGSRGGSASGLNLYEDSVLQTNVSRTGNFATGTAQTSANFSIGSRQSTSDLYFNGTIDEVSVFNSELSASDVTAIYGTGVPTSLASLSPLSWWRCGDGDTSPTLTDNGTGGNDGTMESFSTFSPDVPT